MTVRDCISQVFLNEYKKIVEAGLHYISFALVGLGIEFLGACLDQHSFGVTRQSETRFILAISKLFPRKYRDHKKALYEDLRCGFAHQFRPGFRFSLTHREESRREHTRHLGIHNRKTILVAEDFYSDFQKACRKVIAEIDTGKLAHPKLSQRFLNVT